MFCLQFFGHDVAAGMRQYRNQGKYDLQDCESTAKFVSRIADLAKAMNSGGSVGALWADCKEEKASTIFWSLHATLHVH